MEEKVKVKRGRGNPSFVKGCKGGPGRPAGLKIKITQCAEFMEREGWKELMWLAKYRGPRGMGTRNQVPASTLLAAYGFGRPSENVDLTSDGQAVDVVSFLSGAKLPDSLSKGGTT